MIDVDYFKAYNDSMGHLMGDDCLRSIAAVLQASTRRAGETAARFGGEDFAIILPDYTYSQAQVAGDRICERVAALRVHHPTSPLSSLTVSVGIVVVIPVAGTTSRMLLEKADHALYGAKGAGRNRCVVLEVVGA